MAAISCSLFTSLDGLQNGDDGGADSSLESSASDGSVDSSTSPPDAGAIDSGLALLSCDADGLVAYWPMDEGSGLTITDCHQGIVGLLQGATEPTWGTRAGGANVEFSSPGNIGIGIETVLQLGGPFTISGWFRSDAPPSAGGYASMFWSFDNQTGFEVTHSSDGLLYAQIGFEDAAIRADFSQPPYGTWQHLTAVFEPGINLRVYVNGAIVQTMTMLENGDPLPNVPAAPNNESMYIGPLFSSTWTGGVDDVRIFSRALSDDEIAFLAAH
ncbi:MAG: LamG domain-containing protein [Polyangiaceae bacterium]